MRGSSSRPRTPIHRTEPHPRGGARGRAYDGTDPREDPGHYVAHTYTMPSPQETVEPTVTWRATFTVPGLPPLQLTDLPKTARESFAVVDARSQLVAG